MHAADEQGGTALRSHFFLRPSKENHYEEESDEATDTDWYLAAFFDGSRLRRGVLGVFRGDRLDPGYNDRTKR